MVLASSFFKFNHCYHLVTVVNAAFIKVTFRTTQRHIARFAHFQYLQKIPAEQKFTSLLSRQISTMDPRGSEEALFSETKDRFDCVILDLRKKRHHCEEEEFEEKISGSLRSWKADGVRAVTVFVPLALSPRIQTLAKLGFDFHHANPGYVLMLKWLSETDDNNFPPYANQYLGVGGMVVNDKDEILVIKERFAFGSEKARWKLPGGGADPGEELSVTAQREVFEETGIHSEFVGVLAYRHQHQFRYSCSDFYFVCLMRALSTEINKCDQEVLECRWMKISELEVCELYPTNRFSLDSYLQYLKTGVLIEQHDIPSYTGKLYHKAYRPGKVSEKGTSSTERSNL